MEVTKMNFEEVLPEVLSAIRAADFIAIDTNAETTGFLLHDESLNYRDLKGSDWYNTLLKHQTTRSSLDFGVAIFKQEDSMSSTKRFRVQCYNMPILFAYVEEHDARQEIRDERYAEERLDIDAHGFEFMQRTNFDLEKTLYSGTPFMNLQRQREAIDYMEKNPDFMTISGKHMTNGDLDEKYFPKVIEKLGPDDIQEIIKRLRGIGKIFDVTAETKIPVIGHNLLIKLIMLYKDFVEYLPDQFTEFLGKLENVLPQFYDTKFMASEIGQRSNLSEQKKNLILNTNLYELYRNTGWIGQFEVSFVLEESSILYEDDLQSLRTKLLEQGVESFCYESGFDSCVTGIVFAKLVLLSCSDFDVKLFPEYAKLWRNRMFIPKEIESTIHGNGQKVTDPVAGSSSSISSKLQNIKLG